jgi:hypothetical protein
VLKFLTTIPYHENMDSCLCHPYSILLQWLQASVLTHLTLISRRLDGDTDGGFPRREFLSDIVIFRVLLQHALLSLMSPRRVSSGHYAVIQAPNTDTAINACDPERRKTKQESHALFQLLEYLCTWTVKESLRMSRSGVSSGVAFNGIRNRVWLECATRC